MAAALLTTPSPLRRVRTMRNVHALRVNQLDAARLDDEISTLLQQELEQVLPWHGRLLEIVRPEANCLLQAVLWRFTVWVDSPTPGAQLQNLQYARAGSSSVKVPLTRKQKVGILFLAAGVPWLLQRTRRLAEILERASGVSGEGRLVSMLRVLVRWYLRSIVPAATAVYSASAAVNLLLFLRNGIFSTLGHRLLGVRMLHIDATAKRQVAFEYMNRVMIWNGLSEFLMTTLPLINLQQIRRSVVRRLFPKVASRSLPEGACGFCGDLPANVPMRNKTCGHVFCYFCIASEKLERQGTSVACPQCGAEVEDCNYAQG
eukprot:TRINITY_DN18670_c0_g1_i2.p1 TRINITY_DN18670_c0_g1~~TRINITY_DN18670_c0_g1_i2.p1  ORF type:complete len:317 (-),score=54.97 TRINITY_DN18670_c0_g1_i2:113-1063(-)